MNAAMRMMSYVKKDKKKKEINNMRKSMQDEREGGMRAHGNVILVPNMFSMVKFTQSFILRKQPLQTLLFLLTTR